MRGKGFDPEFMSALKQKNDIIEVISGYVSLDRKGNTHWACCPFHHEKTPSFAVNEAEQFYHCFGCGVSGDVVRFVQEIESTDLWARYVFWRQGRRCLCPKAILTPNKRCS